MVPAEPDPTSQHAAAVVAQIDAQNPFKEWEDRLRQHPDSYGGWIFESDGSITVLERGSNAAFEREARDGPVRAPMDMEAGSAREPRIRRVNRSFRELNSARDALALRLGGLNRWGIFGVGLDVAGNSVILLTTDAAKAESYFTTQEGGSLDRSMIDVQVDEIPVTVAGRYSDSPPWNGGNQILNSNVNNKDCTSGFGVHSGSYNNRYLSTAGHCRPGTWKNGGNTIGSTLNNAVVTGPVLDSQIIPAWSSCIVWKGQSTNSTNLQRWFLTGFINMASSGTVYMEGYKSRQVAGSITGTNMTVTVTDPFYGTYTIQQAIRINKPSQLGDSGGSVVASTGYGPLAISHIISTTSTNTFSQNIGAYLYSYGVQLNITTSSTVCTNA